MEDQDITKALLQLKASFQQAGLKAPVGVMLSNREEGLRLMDAMKQTFYLYQVFPDKEHGYVTSVDVVGINIRWPTKLEALPGGEASAF